MNDVKRAAALAMSFLLAVGTISTTVFAQDATADEQPDVAFDAERSGFNDETQRYELYFVINENTDAAEVDVEVGDYFIQMIDAHEAYLVPGDKFQADVYIENASGHTYAYQSGGLSVSTPGFGSEEVLSPFVGFDGKQIPYASIVVMSTDDEVIRSLFGGSTRLQLNDLLGIYDRLAEEGYEGEDALTSYTLDDYRTKDGVDYADWADFIEQSGPSYGNGGDRIAVADIEKVSEYNGNAYTWVSSEDAITLTIRAEDNHIVLEYRRDVKTTDPVDPNEPQDPQTPTAPDDPETGIGDTLALWGILLGASAALAAAFGVKRKISR